MTSFHRRVRVITDRKRVAELTEHSIFSFTSGLGTIVFFFVFFTHAEHSVCRRVGWKNPQPARRPVLLPSLGAHWSGSNEGGSPQSRGIPRGKFPTQAGYVKHTKTFAISSPTARHLAPEEQATTLRRCRCFKCDFILLIE